MTKENNKVLSKWKKSKRSLDRLDNKLSGVANKAMNRFLNTNDDDNKLDLLDEAIDNIPDVSEKERRDKFKIGDNEYRFNISGNITKDILMKLFEENGGKDIDPAEVKKRADELLGDPLSESVQFKFFKIPENDRLKHYQLLIKYSNYCMHEKQYKNKKGFPDIWDNLLLPAIENGEIFEIEDSLIGILNNTKSDVTEIPFGQILIDCRVPIEDRIYHGFMASRYIVDNDGEVGIFVDDEDIDIKKTFCGFMSCYTKINKEKDERQIFLEFMYDNDINQNPKDSYNKYNKYQKKIINFFYSFCNFINEPEVRIVDNEFNPKNNKRRVEKGKMPLPANKRIVIDGNLKKYISDYNSGLSHGLSCRFSVRGHFMHFRDEKRYSNLYEISEEYLLEKGYQKVNGVIKKWVKPYIKGNGIFVKKDYKIIKGGKNEINNKN